MKICALMLSLLLVGTYIGSAYIVETVPVEVTTIPIPEATQNSSQNVSQPEPLPFLIEVLSIVKKDKNGEEVTRDYMFTGETITYTLKLNPLGTASSIAVYISGLPEAGCRYDSLTGKYTCIYTVEPAYTRNGTVWNLGQKEVYIVASRLGYIVETPKLTVNFNPGATTSPTVFSYPVLVNPVISFPPMSLGTTIYSNNVNVYVDNGGGPSAKLYIQGKRVYSSAYNTGNRCPWSNYYDPSNIYYTKNGGATWTRLSTSKVLLGTDSVNLQFKTKIPTICVGAYDLTKAFTFSSVVIR
jgi:hypothetical protein